MSAAGEGAAGKTSYGFIPAVSVIIANMIGTGVFTSLGFQLQDLAAGFPILLLWALGGAAAFAGAMSYAELGAALPRSGRIFALARNLSPRRRLRFRLGFINHRFRRADRPSRHHFFSLRIICASA